MKIQGLLATEITEATERFKSFIQWVDSNAAASDRERMGSCIVSVNSVHSVAELHLPVQANATSIELVISAMRCICSMTEACCSSVSAAQQSSRTTIS